MMALTRAKLVGAAAFLAAGMTITIAAVASGQGPFHIGTEENIPPRPGVSSEPVEFQEFNAVGFQKAQNAAEKAIAAAPFPAGLPTHLPAGVSLWHVSQYTDVKSGKGNLELYWTAPPLPDGSPLPGLRISWTTAAAPEDIEAKLPPVVEDGTFNVAGLNWRWYFIRWRDFDMYQARTFTPEGVLISSDIRVVGMDKSTAFGELQAVLSSLPERSDQRS